MTRDSIKEKEEMSQFFYWLEVSLFPSSNAFSNEKNNRSCDMFDYVFQKLYNFKLSVI